MTDESVTRARLHDLQALAQFNLATMFRLLAEAMQPDETVADFLRRTATEKPDEGRA